MVVKKVVTTFEFLTYITHIVNRKLTHQKKRKQYTFRNTSIIIANMQIIVITWLGILDMLAVYWCG